MQTDYGIIPLNVILISLTNKISDQFELPTLTNSENYL